MLKNVSLFRFFTRERLDERQQTYNNNKYNIIIIISVVRSDVLFLSLLSIKDNNNNNNNRVLIAEPAYVTNVLIKNSRLDWDKKKELSRA